MPLIRLGRISKTILFGHKQVTDAKADLKSSVDSYCQAVGNVHVRISIKMYELVRGLRDLQAEETVIQKAADKSFVVPYQQNPHFIGRTKLLQMLREKLLAKIPNRFNHRIALQGMAGVGKSQCALAYVYENKDCYKRIYWISGESRASLLLGYQKIANDAKLAVVNGTNPAEIADLVFSWLRQQPSWLLVVDNLDDIKVADSVLPENGPQTHTILTTRDRNAAGIPAESLEVDILGMDDSIALLSVISGCTSQSNLGELERIVMELGYLPLAIEQAAAYVREVTGDFSSYFHEYQRNRKTLNRWVSKGNRAYPHSVATVLSLLFRAVQRSNRQAARLLQLLSFLNPNGTLIEFLQTGRETLGNDLQTMFTRLSDMAIVLLELEKSSLIKWDRSNKTILVHRLVQTIIRDDMTDEELNTTEIVILRLCDKSFPDTITTNTLPLCRKYQDQVLEPLLNTTVRTLEAANVKERIGKFLETDGKYHSAECLFEKAYQIRSELQGTENPETFTTLLHLAGVHWHQGRMAKAAQLEEQVIEGRKRILGNEHRDTLAAMNNLALTYRALGRLEDMLRLQEEVLEKHTKILGEEHKATLTVMNNLSWAYREQGRVPDAIRLQEKVLKTRTKVLGEEHPFTLTIKHSLALSYRDQGRMTEAAKLQEEVLNMRVRFFGEDHPYTLAAMLNLALTYWDQGRMKEAAELEEAVLDRRIRIFGSDHVDTLTVMHNLGSTYRDLGRLTEAGTLQELVLEKRRVILGGDHPDTLKTMHTLARTYSAEGRFADASKLEEEAVEKRRTLLGDRHPDTVRSLEHLAEVHGFLNPKDEDMAILGCK